MAIPAQSTVPIPAGVYDSLLVRNLIYSGADAFSLTVSRFSAATGLEQPGSVKASRVADPTLLTALRGLITEFMTERGLVGNLLGLTISGSVANGILRGSLRLLLNTGVTVISDVFGEAVKDAAFGQMLTDFLTAVGTYNAEAKVI